jgi:hypothetical protein
MVDRYERLWRDYWRETHKPDANGEFYFDRHDREDAQRQSVIEPRAEAALTHPQEAPNHG